MQNKVTVSGTASLYKDAEIRANGKLAVLTFSTVESWKDRVTGEDKRNVTWHRVTTFNPKLVEFASTLKAGDEIEFVGADLKTTSYVKDGVEKKSTDIVLKWADLKDGTPCLRRLGGNFASAPKSRAPAPVDSFDSDMPF